MSDEVKQLVITTLTEKTIQGKEGPFTVWVVNGKWEAGKGKWSGDWKVGGNARGVFKEVAGKTGNVYYKIGCPPDLMPKDRGGFGGGNQYMEAISENILAIRLMLAKKLGGDSPAQTTAEAQPEPMGSGSQSPESQPTPTTEDEIDVSAIPF